MLKLYFTSMDISVDYKRKNIKSIAVYDINLLADFLGNLMFTGNSKKLVEANEVLERFLSLLRPDSTHLNVENNVLQVAMYTTDYIPADEVDYELGTRPQTPYHDVLNGAKELAHSMSYNTSSAADAYRNLQALFEKHPELPRKSS